MHDDAPAALPLIAFTAGLALGPHLVNPVFTAAALILLTFWKRPCLILALGIAAGCAADARRAEERAAFESFRGFVRVEAPLQRDWSLRSHVFVLTAHRFRADGHEFDAPLSIYARFAPPPFDDEATVTAEGFLRRNEHGRYTLTVKSSRLLAYRGRVSGFAPSTWNRRLAQRLKPFAAERPQEIAMIEALALGRGERLDEATRTEYRRGGTYHLLVFSGLQIALAAALIALLLRWAGWTRVSDLCLLAFALLAPPFIGPTASVSRASLGIGLYAVSRIAGRPTSFENLWCVAALVRLLLVPGDLTDPAFHLTYAGAGALIFIGKPLSHTRLRWLSYALAAEIAIVPLTLFHFHQYALGGSVATVAMTPLVFLQLLAGSAFAAIRLGVLLDLVRWLNVAADWINTAASPASGFFAAPHAIAIAAAYSAAMTAIVTLRGRLRAVAIALALLLATGAAVARHLGARDVAVPTITFLDVGQGDAILIRSGRHAALIDGGAHETMLLPLLVDRGVRELDFVALTHAHPDHCGGLPAVVRELDANVVVISPQRFRGECAGSLLATSANFRLLQSPARMRVGEIDVSLLPPSRHYRRAEENNSSIVARATARGRSALLTGDIQHEAETDLIDRMAIRADILKVPHHGSKSSTGGALMRAVNPRIAVISCGRANVFGHPHHQVLETLASLRVRVLRTDLNGSIDVTLQRTITVTPQIDTPP